MKAVMEIYPAVEFFAADVRILHEKKINVLALSDIARKENVAYTDAALKRKLLLSVLSAKAILASDLRALRRVGLIWDKICSTIKI